MPLHGGIQKLNIILFIFHSFIHWFNIPYNNLKLISVLYDSGIVV